MQHDPCPALGTIQLVGARSTPPLTPTLTLSFITILTCYALKGELCKLYAKTWLWLLQLVKTRFHEIPEDPLRAGGLRLKAQPLAALLHLLG